MMAQPWRILYTIPNFLTAGSGFALYQLITRLDRDRFEPHVAVTKRGGTLAESLEENGIPVHLASLTTHSRPYLTLPWRLRAQARASGLFDFPIWHSFHYLDDYSEPLIARRCGAKFWVYTKKNMSWNERSWRLRSRFADRIAAQNTYMLQHFFDTASLRDKAIFIPPSVDTHRFEPRIDGPRPDLLAAVPEKAILAVNVAHLIPLKGQEHLIRAIAEVPDLHFAIAGREDQPDYAARLRALVQDLGIHDRVHFLGPVHDIPGLLNAADLFLFGSIREACPVAVLEAMSCGIACVVPDIPGCRDMIESSAQGLHVPYGDQHALVSAIRRLVANADLRRSMGRAARTRVLERFSIDQEVAAYESLYVSMVTNSPHRKRMTSVEP